MTTTRRFPVLPTLLVALAVAAMIALGLQVYREPTSITDEQIDELRGYGYSDREISDVVGVVSLNILTGAFNLVAGLTPGD